MGKLSRTVKKVANLRNRSTDFFVYYISGTRYGPTCGARDLPASVGVGSPPRVLRIGDLAASVGDLAASVEERGSAREC